MRQLFFILSFALSGVTASAVSLHGLFAEGMVLQADAPVPVLGKAQPDTEVIVKIAGQELRAVTNNDGDWRVVLAPVQAGGPHQLIIDSSGKTTSISDVWFGDLWLASGQSNMMWPLSQTLDAEQEITECADPQMRFFLTKESVARKPCADIEGKWLRCAPATAGRFSGVAYYFARALRKNTGRPVGILQSAIGGTPLWAWKRAEILLADPRTPDYWEGYNNYAEEEQKRTSSESSGARAQPPAARRMPSGYYNAMIAPLTVFPIKGVIWYQGEGNNRSAGSYEKEFSDLITDWRHLWNQPQLPFLFAQLAAYEGGPKWIRHNWPYLRDAQRRAWLNIPGTGMAVAIDVGERKNIHPANKRAVGERLALWAKKIAYNQNVIASGPDYRKTTLEDGGRLRVHFNYAENGLKTRSGGLGVRSFQLAGWDGVFHEAEATIEGDTVVLRSERVPFPRNIRYAWDGFPEVDLMNADGLPAVPFRTDDIIFVGE